MRRLAAILAVLAAAVALAACGTKTTVREGPVTVRDSASGAVAREPAGSAGGGRGGVRIFVVTHGQASSPFWAIVRNGVAAAARQVDALVTYRAPDVYSVAHMETLIDQAVAAHPDGLVVSIPEAGVDPAIRRAVRAGIPVVSINSGIDQYKKLGILAHVGQPEDRAGEGAGRRLAAEGARRVLCLNHQPGNIGLDQRCAGLAQAMRAAGGRSKVVPIGDQDPKAPRQIAAAVAAWHADAVLALNATGGMDAVHGLAGAHEHARVATFDLGPDVLEAVRQGKIAFAVDQQAYLQGYLPVVLLAERARYGLFPAQGDVIPTGPNFVTKANAAKAIDLAQRSIR